MIRETDTAIVKKLENFAIPHGAETLSVPAAIGPVEEFLKKKQHPSINVMRIMPRPDFSRFTTFAAGGYDAEAGRHWEQRFATPYVVMYQIDFIAKFQNHAVSIFEEMLRRFPAVGFGQEITVDGYDVPFRYVGDPRDLTKYDTEADREFRMAFTIAVETWSEQPKVYTTTE